MSSEVCPFCGKTYKRLKSHLPHCKAAAASSKTPQPKHGAVAGLTSSQLAAALTKPRAKGDKSTQTLSVPVSPQSKKSKKVSVVSVVSSTPETHSLSASAQSFPLSPALPLSKKKNQKLSEQIKTAAVPSAATISLSTQPQSPPLASTISKPKKKSTLIKAAKSKQVTEGLLEGTRSAPEDLLSGSTPFGLDLLSSRTTAQIDTNTHPDKDTAQRAFLSTDDKPKGASKKKVSETKKAAQSLSTTKYNSSSLGSKVNESSARDYFLVDHKEEIEDLSANKMFLNSSGHQARITLQDVKATLGRGNTTRQFNRPSILSQITQDLSRKIKPGAGLVPTTAQTDHRTHPDKASSHLVFVSADNKPKVGSTMKASKTKKAAQSLSTTEDSSSSLDSKVRGGNATCGTTTDLSRPGTGLSLVPLPTGSQKDVVSCLGTINSMSNQLPSTTLQNTERSSVKKKSSKSKQAPLIPLRHDGSSQLELPTLAAPLLSGHLSSQWSQAKPPPHISMNEGVKVNSHMTGLATISPSLNQFSSPQLFPLAPQSLPLKVETLRADAGLGMEKLQLGISKQNTTDNGTKGALTHRSLGQVKLRELPEWLACNTPSHPRDVVEMVQRGWQWYYKKYIDVKKGGVGGLGMLLAGYCVLSYIWSYPHIKRDRWRKHH